MFRNNDTGKEFQLNHKDLIAQQGKYFIGARFKAIERSSATGEADESLEATLELIDDDLTRHLVYLKEHK
jgi:hypothetical protein